MLIKAWNKNNIWQTKFFPCPFCNNMNQLCMHTKNKKSHSSNNTHIEHFQTKTKRLWSKVYQEKWKRPKNILNSSMSYIYNDKSFPLFSNFKIDIVTLWMYNKKKSLTFSWKTKQKQIILVLFFNENKELLDLEK